MRTGKPVVNQEEWSFGRMARKPGSFINKDATPDQTGQISHIRYFERYHRTKQSEVTLQKPAGIGSCQQGIGSL